MHWEELWTGDGFRARFFRTLLIPVSWLYAIGWQLYLAIYQLGLKKAQEPHRPVICIGNLLVGGTGKTPTTLHIADLIAGLGRAVVISCSGYGSPASEAARMAPEGELKASDWGDEAALMRWLRPGIPLIVGRRRVLAAELCHRHFPDAVLLMDDGFQHLPLKKHLTIVLDPAQANCRCLPAGPYREPRHNLGRADLVVGAGAYRLEARDAPIDGGKVGVICALGRPQGFLARLREQGLTLDPIVLRGDHDPLTDGNLMKGFQQDRPIATTGKDWVKLRERPDVESYDFVVAPHEVSIEPGDAFLGWLRERLNGISIEKEL